MKTSSHSGKSRWPWLAVVAFVALLLGFQLFPSSLREQAAAQQPPAVAPRAVPSVRAVPSAPPVSVQVQSLAQQPALPVLDVARDFGAKGNGQSNDTGAFARLAREVNRRGGGVEILIPPGQYIVGGQVSNGRNADNNVYRFDGIDVLALVNCSRPVRIEGAGAVLRLPAGMKFGSFNRAGSRLDPPLPFWDVAQSAITGYLVSAVGCADVSVHGLELDGNNTHYELGGLWGDRDRQCRSYGFYFNLCKRVTLDGVSAHHFGLDGLYIKQDGLKEGGPATPHTLRDCRFEWNGRQGLSWCGGIGLRAERCSFAHTGYAVNLESGQPLSNAPAAGVDIEAERSVCRDGQFVDCDFFHTRGPNLYSETGDNAGVSFERCRFWNFDNYSIVPHNPRLSFTDCRIYGSAISAFSSKARPQDATHFVRCAFEDKKHPTLGAPFVDPYGSLLAFDDLHAGLLFQDCTFVAHNVKGPFIRDPRGGETDGFTIDGGSMRLEHWNGPGESAATLQGGRVRNFQIQSAWQNPAAPSGLHIWTNNQTLVGQNVSVEGPGLVWRAPGGERGALRAQE